MGKAIACCVERALLVMGATVMTSFWLTACDGNGGQSPRDTAGAGGAGESTGGAPDDSGGTGAAPSGGTAGTGGSPMGGIGGMAGAAVTPQGLPFSGQTGCAYEDADWMFDATCAEDYQVGSVSTPFGQDAHYRSEFAAIDLNVSDGGVTVTDGNTELVWQRCSQGQIASGDDCTGMPTASDFAAATAYCAGLALADRSWRLPTIQEYMMLMDFSQRDPALDENLFPGTESGVKYWTATESPDSEQAFIQWIFYGDQTLASTSSTFPVRCVSGDEFAPDLEALENGTVIDGPTQRQFTACPLATFGSTPTVATEANCADSGLANWTEALEACENLSFAGFDDWRLPSVREFGYIQDRSTPGFLDPVLFLGSSTREAFTATSRQLLTNGVFNFEPDLLRGNSGKASDVSVYCVR